MLCRFDLFYIQLWSILLSTLHILSSAIYKSTMRSTRNAQDRQNFLIFSLGPHIFTQPVIGRFSLSVSNFHSACHRHVFTQPFVLNKYSLSPIFFVALFFPEYFHLTIPPKNLHFSLSDDVSGRVPKAPKACSEFKFWGGVFSHRGLPLREAIRKT